ncbi:MAG: hypothetical protein ACOYO0_11685 [Sandarakinorhabdus sp.]
MIRTGMMMMATLLVATPALAWDGPRERREDRRDVSRAAQRVQDERGDLYRAQQRGNPREIRQESRELRRAERELQRERADLANNRYGNQRYAYGGPGYDQGNGPGWQQDGWRQQGWHAEQFYRPGGNYRPVNLGRNDQVWRGYDNRNYCRRNDGTTGLIIGGLAGGTLGNVIAPGGSKLLGSIIGGGLGAVLGNSIDRGQVVCQ